MLELFQNKIEDLVIPNSKVAVAVSGGVDSVVLLHLTVNWTQKNNFPLPIVLTVDHKLRPESRDEANFVVDYARQLGTDSFILDWEKEGISGNIQSQARKARYKLLTEWCKSNNNIQYLLVAHHRDDQAETFLLRLERGSGIDGLSAMNYQSFLNGVCILRPLLDFSRSDIEKYAKHHQLKWIEDRSNKDLKYRRTLYRNLLKTIDNQDTLTQRISLCILHMNRAKQALIHYTRLALDECIDVHDFGYIEIQINKFHKLPEEIALRILLYSIMAISGKYYKPRYNSLTFIFNKILNQDNNIDHTFSGCKIKKYKESILILREISKVKTVTVNLPTDKPIRWDNRFNCMVLVNQKCSVIIAPLKKIPDFFKSYDCYPEVFYSLPVVQKGKEIFAYPYTKTNAELQYIVNCTIKENLISLAR